LVENMRRTHGISDGIDLALAWVEEDCGNRAAAEVARELVLFSYGLEDKLSSAGR
jgi:transcriptional regulator GlxA family with amidase domain